MNKRPSKFIGQLLFSFGVPLAICLGIIWYVVQSIHTPRDDLTQTYEQVKADLEARGVIDKLPDTTPKKDAHAFH